MIASVKLHGTEGVVQAFLAGKCWIQGGGAGSDRTDLWDRLYTT